jgi:uncharacterized protein YodC (DUF2158 family)
MGDKEFKKGNVVKVIAGGPDMTVENVDRGRVYCVWFVGAELYRDVFESEVLEFIRE